jgi:hypothetical protein
MVVSPDPFLDECFIKKPIKKQPISESQEQCIIQESSPIDLDNLINESVKDLAKKNVTIQSESIKDKNIVSSLKPIDLEVSFDKPLENDKILTQNNNSSNQFDLEEADIDFTSFNEVKQDIEELEPKEEIKEDPTILKEVDLTSTLDNSLETIQLKKPNKVYYEIYQKAREKAKDAKKNAILAYLEMKNIKKTYMLDDIDESDSEFDEFASRDSSSEISDAESLEDNF